MEKTMYWAVLLNKDAQEKLKKLIPPKHPNVYAEHMTLAFKPDKITDEILMKRLGEDVNITIISVHSDNKGQAVGAFSDQIDRIDVGPAHITISCADGIKPVYSNKLIDKDNADGLLCSIAPFLLSGKIARYTSSGWIIDG